MRDISRKKLFLVEGFPMRPLRPDVEVRIRAVLPHV
jgi:hypothetical protein